MVGVQDNFILTGFISSVKQEARSPGRVRMEKVLEV